MTRNRSSTQALGFTLIELIVVIGILVILIGLLIPVVSKVRRAGYQADSQAFISQLAAACQMYYSEHKAYPGPIPNAAVYNSANTTATLQGTLPVAFDYTAAAGYDTTSQPIGTFVQLITGAENLVLGLCGGLRINDAGTSGTGDDFITYDPAAVGTGPGSLNPMNPKKYKAYAEALNVTPSFLGGVANKHGHYVDGAGAAIDSLIPEFQDRYPDGMPILYLRARLGVPPMLLSAATDAINSVVTSNTSNGTYDLRDIIGYTGQNIGVGKGLKPGDYKGVTPGTHGLRSIGRGVTMTAATAVNDATLDGATHYPFNAFAYLRDPANGLALTNSQTARSRDSFILLSAGADRVYGTTDDLTSFGPVQ